MTRKFKAKSQRLDIAAHVVRGAVANKDELGEFCPTVHRVCTAQNNYRV